MRKTKIDEIDEARRVLGLGGEARLKEVKDAYKSLAKKHHPDGGGKGDEIKKINQAYETIMQYIQDYRYSFRKEDVLIQYPEEVFKRNYEEDWLWGRGGYAKKRGD